MGQRWCELLCTLCSVSPGTPLGLFRFQTDGVAGIPGIAGVGGWRGPRWSLTLGMSHFFAFIENSSFSVRLE